MAKLKLDWNEFVGLAMSKLEEKHPNINLHLNEKKPKDISYPDFVKERHGEGEGSMTELPDYVYIDLRS